MKCEQQSWKAIQSLEGEQKRKLIKLNRNMSMDGF